MYRVMIISFVITALLAGCVMLYIDSPPTNRREVVNTNNIARDIEDNESVDEQQ